MSHSKLLRLCLRRAFTMNECVLGLQCSKKILSAVSSLGLTCEAKEILEECRNVGHLSSINQYVISGGCRFSEWVSFLEESSLMREGTLSSSAGAEGDKIAFRKGVSRVLRGMTIEGLSSVSLLNSSAREEIQQPELLTSIDGEMLATIETVCVSVITERLMEDGPKGRLTSDEWLDLAYALFAQREAIDSAAVKALTVQFANTFSKNATSKARYRTLALIPFMDRQRMILAGEPVALSKGIFTTVIDENMTTSRDTSDGSSNEVDSQGKCYYNNRSASNKQNEVRYIKTIAPFLLSFQELFSCEVCAAGVKRYFLPILPHLEMLCSTIVNKDFVVRCRQTLMQNNISLSQMSEEEFCRTGIQFVSRFSQISTEWERRNHSVSLIPFLKELQVRAFSSDRIMLEITPTVLTFIPSDLFQNRNEMPSKLYSFISKSRFALTPKGKAAFLVVMTRVVNSFQEVEDYVLNVSQSVRELPSYTKLNMVSDLAFSIEVERHLFLSGNPQNRLKRTFDMMNDIIFSVDTMNMNNVDASVLARFVISLKLLKVRKHTPYFRPIEELSKKPDLNKVAKSIPQVLVIMTCHNAGSPHAVHTLLDAAIKGITDPTSGEVGAVQSSPSISPKDVALFLRCLPDIPQVGWKKRSSTLTQCLPYAPLVELDWLGKLHLLVAMTYVSRFTEDDGIIMERLIRELTSPSSSHVVCKEYRIETAKIPCDLFLAIAEASKVVSVGNANGRKVIQDGIEFTMTAMRLTIPESGSIYLETRGLILQWEALWNCEATVGMMPELQQLLAEKYVSRTKGEWEDMSKVPNEGYDSTAADDDDDEDRSLMINCGSRPDKTSGEFLCLQLSAVVCCELMHSPLLKHADIDWKVLFRHVNFRRHNIKHHHAIHLSRLVVFCSRRGSNEAVRQAHRYIDFLEGSIKGIGTRSLWACWHILRECGDDEGEITDRHRALSSEIMRQFRVQATSNEIVAYKKRGVQF